MNNYISQYTTDKTGIKATTQSKINASIKSLKQMIDEYESPSEIQNYGEINYKGTIFSGLNLSSNVKPKTQINVNGKCGTWVFPIGYVNTDGVLVVDYSPIQNKRIEETIVLSQNTTHTNRDYHVPADSQRQVSQNTFNDTIEMDGLEVNRYGVETTYRQVSNVQTDSWEEGGDSAQIYYAYDTTTTYFSVIVANYEFRLQNAIFTIRVRWRSK